MGTPIHQIESMREERATSFERMKEINDLALSEERDLTGEETQEYEKVEARFDTLSKQIDRTEQLEGIAPKMTRSSAAPEDEGTTPAGEQKLPETYAEFQERRSGPRPQDDLEYRQKLYEWLATGKEFDPGAELRTLSKASAAAGANLVPTEFSNRVIELQKEYGVLAQLATEIVTDSGETIQIPSETTAGVAAWTAENAAFAESDDAFGQLSLSAYKATRIVKVSEELLADSAYNLEAHLQMSFARSFGILENTAYVVGDGSSKPTGITTQSTLGVAAAGAAAITADEIMDLYHSLLPPYRRNAAFLAKDGSIKNIRKLKTGVSGDNTYLWQPGLQAGQPDQLLGVPIYTDPDMPAMTTGLKSVLFGDFSYYWIRRARGLALQRLNELYAANGQVGFRGYIRVDGKLTDTAAVKHLIQA